MQRKKQAGEITESEYNELLSIILNSSKSGSQGASSAGENRATLRTSSKSWPVQINLLITKYWRAKELVCLNTELELQCNGRAMPGNILVMDSDKILIAFIGDIGHGSAHFRIRYRPKVKDQSRGTFVSKSFDFEFLHNVTGEVEISKVIDFIEVKGRDGSIADAKFLDQDEYQQLIEKRRGKEQKDKELFDKFLGKKK